MSNDGDVSSLFFQSPWKNIFLWHLMDVRKGAKIVSPTIDMDILRKIQSILIANKDRKLNLRFLLRFSEEDFITKDIDPETLKILALLQKEPNSKIEVRFLPNLNMTVMTFDQAKGIIATGDLSRSDLTDKLTYGNLISGSDVIKGIEDDLKKLWKLAKPMKAAELMAYKDQISERMELRRSTLIEDPGTEEEFSTLDMISIGDPAEQQGADRDEPHLDEIKMITKELLARARGALDEEKHEEAFFFLDEGLALSKDDPKLLQEKGKLLFDVKGDFAAATACFEKVLDIDEDNRDAWAYLGMCNHELGDLEEALYDYDQATDIDPNHYPIWIKKGAILGKTKGREEDAIKCLEFALSQDGYNEEAWFNKAQILDQRLHRMEEAILSYRSLLRINPKHVKGSFRLGLLSYKRLNDIKKAKKYFTQVIEADPTHLQGWLFKGEIAEEVDKDFDSAFEFYEQALEHNPGSPEVLHKEIDMLLRHKKKFRHAVELADRLTAVAPEDPLAFYVSGLGAVKIDNDPEKAMSFFNSSIKADPNNKMVIISKANLLAEHMNRPKDAEKMLRAALKKEDKHADLWVELGLVYFDFLYEPKEALECFEKVTELDPKNSEGWYQKGMILTRGFERHQEALKCLDEATKLSDENADAWCEKGKILRQAFSMPDDAIKCFNKALSFEPEEPEFLSEIARSFIQKGDMTMGIINFSKALEMDPSYWEASLGLAEAMYKNGDFNGAHVALNGALQSEPKNEKVWSLKAEIFRSQNELEKGLECYKRVLRFNPDNQEALNSKTAIEAQLEKKS
ncbi:MAG: tetratricopeptide repeat protein [Thermoplasmata archaeon]|nr:tetratricopeptide repeat protein [Thermoplasmata archaeon]